MLENAVCGFWSGSKFGSGLARALDPEISGKVPGTVFVPFSGTRKFPDPSFPEVSGKCCFELFRATKFLETARKSFVSCFIGNFRTSRNGTKIFGFRAFSSNFELEDFSKRLEMHLFSCFLGKFRASRNGTKGFHYRAFSGNFEPEDFSIKHEMHCFRAFSGSFVPLVTARKISFFVLFREIFEPEDTPKRHEITRNGTKCVVFVLFRELSCFFVPQNVSKWHERVAFSCFCGQARYPETARNFPKRHEMHWFRAFSGHFVLFRATPRLDTA